MFKIFRERDVGGEVPEGWEGIHDTHDFAEVMEGDALELESIKFAELGEMSTQDDLLCWRERGPIYISHLHRLDLCKAWNVGLGHRVAEKDLASNGSSECALEAEILAILFSHSQSSVVDLDAVNVVRERALLRTGKVEETSYSPRPELYGGEYVVAATNEPFRANDSAVP